MRAVAAIRDREDRLFELIDGVLVEKTTGLRESILTAVLGGIMGAFVKPHKLGLIAGPDGAVKLAPWLVRIPDVAYFSWDQFSGRKLPRQKIPALAPCLAVEVLSEDNTKREMDRKLKDYFASGIERVWFLVPRTAAAEVFTGPGQSEAVPAGGTLDGGDLLPGLKLSLKEFFEEVPEEEDEAPPPRKKRPSRVPDSSRRPEYLVPPGGLVGGVEHPVEPVGILNAVHGGLHGRVGRSEATTAQSKEYFPGVAQLALFDHPHHEVGFLQHHSHSH